MSHHFTRRAILVKISRTIPQARAERLTATSRPYRHRALKIDGGLIGGGDDVNFGSHPCDVEACLWRRGPGFIRYSLAFAPSTKGIPSPLRRPARARDSSASCTASSQTTLYTTTSRAKPFDLVGRDPGFSGSPPFADTMASRSGALETLLCPPTACAC